MSDWDRFVILWNALPDEFRRQCSLTGQDILIEAAVAESNKASERQIDQVLSSLMGQALRVPSKKIANPRQTFHEFVQSQPERVLAYVESLLVKWTGLSGDAKAAVIVTSLPPEAAAQVFQALQPVEVQRIISNIARLPPIPAGLRNLWLDEFMGMEKSNGDAQAQATALAVRDPKLFARILKERWLQA